MDYKILLENSEKASFPPKKFAKGSTPPKNSLKISSGDLKVK